MLNCLWSLENERSSECWGGASASPIVKAVLDNVGRRYLVEHTEADDGSWQYDLYSDGFLVQRGQALFSIKTNTIKTISLPKAFGSTNYFVVATRQNWTDGNIPLARPNTETNFFGACKEYGGSKTDTCTWIAMGYAA